ncbi:MAG: ABC transporter permease [Planctomycetaceae bacterium]
MSSEPSPSGSLVPREGAFSLLGSALGPFAGLMLVLCVFWGADVVKSRMQDKTPRFLTVDSGRTVLMNASAVGTAALGMTIIIIAGGIDLSAGTAIALSATVAAWCFRAGYNPAVGVLAALLVGCFTGCVNGSLVGLLRVVPFIVTLGTMTLFRGVGRILSDGTPIRAHAKVPVWLLTLQEPEPRKGWEWLMVSPGVWVMLVLAVLTWALLKYTVFGRHAFAIGSNEATARLCGINVPLTRTLVYTIAGFFIGVAGLFQFVVLGGEGDPTAGTGKELEIIAAVVIGGGSLSGGRGSVWGTLSGAAIMAVIRHGCVILGVPDQYQEILIGVIIVAAVTLDRIRQQRLGE